MDYGNIAVLVNDALGTLLEVFGRYLVPPDAEIPVYVELTAWKVGIRVYQRSEIVSSFLKKRTSVIKAVSYLMSNN